MIIIIPIEVKDRELFPKLLIAYYLLKLNKKIKIVLTKSSILIKQNLNNKNLVYFEKSISTHKENLHREFLKENYIVSLDEEGPFYHWPIIFKKNRINLKIISNDNFKYFFLWGKNEKKFFTKKILTNNKKKIIPVGHPKFDFLKKKNHIFYDKELSFIKKKYTKIILVSSSFLYDAAMDEELYNIYIKKNLKNEKGKKQFQNSLKNDFENYTQLIDLTKKIAEKFENHTIIFRPHPMQDINKVKKRFANVPKNLKIIYQFTVTPWIISSAYYIHSHCTTVHEAFFLRKKIYCLRPNIKVHFKKNLTEYGDFFRNKNSLLKKLTNDIKNKNSLNSKICIDKNIINFNKEKDTSELIALLISKKFRAIKSKIEYKFETKNQISFIKRIKYKSLSIAKEIIYKNFKFFYKFLFKFSIINKEYLLPKDYKINKIKSLNKNDIINFFNKVKSSKVNVSVKKINKNIFEIYKKN
tara:strand:+ start:558 stop:1964 length:1407 start_codon:yes stop_codon:yes gene_type:complete